MPKLFWKSLRSRILLLAVLTCLFLASAAFSFFAFLRSSHAAALSTTERHLLSVASGLGSDYTEHMAATFSLRSVKAIPHPHPLPLPPPPPPPPDSTAVPPDQVHPGLPPPPAPDPLSRITERVLRQEPGIEGGFFAAESDTLTGYSFPTHEGPGPNKEMPQRERPTIDNLVHAAVASGSPRTYRFEGPHDAVLFVAVPVREVFRQRDRQDVSGATEITGAVWLMQRIPGFDRGRNRQLLFGSAAFGTAALITALLAFFVTTEVRRGVTAVITRLGSMETDFSQSPTDAIAGPQLEEFERVLRGIDVLASSLRQKIENERALEAEMRHKERLSALGQFAAGIAHELRNPLATIRLRTQMSQRSADGEAVTRNSTVILEEIDRLDTIISRLLYFSRPIQLQLQPVALDDLCMGAATAWNQRPLPQKLTISCTAESGVLAVCDRSRILQVIDNLIENAVQSASTNGEKGGQVTVTTAQHQQVAEITVMDDGPGFAAETLKHVLDPFFTTKESGTGLGLSISFEIVQAHGGELRLNNRPSGGAIASILLPLRNFEAHSFLIEKGAQNHG